MLSPRSVLHAALAVQNLEAFQLNEFLDREVLKPMVDAAQKNNRIVQIGSQRVSSTLLAKAAELYKGGAIGDVEMVELTLGRNDPTGAWEYPPPPDLSPQTLDWDTWLNDAPKVPFNNLHFARWRCWRAYGTGVAGDLMVHLLSGMWALEIVAQNWT